MTNERTPPVIASSTLVSLRDGRMGLQVRVEGSRYSSGTIAGMKRRALLESLPAAALFSATDWLSCTQQKAAQGQASTTVYELRVYSQLR